MGRRLWEFGRFILALHLSLRIGIAFNDIIPGFLEDFSIWGAVFFHEAEFFCLVIDLLIWHLLLFGDRDSKVIMPAGFLWLVGTAWFAGMSILPPPMQYGGFAEFVLPIFVILSLLYFLVWRMGIRSRVFLVCSLTAFLPLIFVVLGLMKHSEFFMKFSLFPIAQSRMIYRGTDVENILVRKLESGFSILLAPVLKKGRGDLPAPSELEQTARESGLPVTDILEIKASADLSFEYLDQPLPQILKQVVAKKGMRLEVASPSASFPLMNVSAGWIFLEDLLAALNQVPGIRVTRKDNTLILEEYKAEILATSPIHLFLGTRRSRTFSFPSEPQFSYFEGHPHVDGAFDLVTSRNPFLSVMYLEIPRRKDGVVDSIIRIEIDYGAWMKAQMKKLAMGPGRTVAVYPMIYGELQKHFPNFKGVLPNGGTGLPVWEVNQQVEFTNSEGDEVVFRGNTVHLKSAERSQLKQISIGTPGGMKIRSPDGKDFIIEGWYFPAIKAELAIAIPMEMVEIIFANTVGKGLLGDGSGRGSFLEVIAGLGSDFQPALPSSLSGEFREFKTVFQMNSRNSDRRKILGLYIRPLNEVAGLTEGKSGEGFIAVCRDITVEKEIDRLKNDFVSQVSHELRTPLTSIQAYTEMLLDGEGEEETRKDYLTIVYQETERLTRLINDLLDIARIESGRRVLKVETLEVAAISREVAQILQGQAESKNMKISQDYDVVVPLMLGDRDLLKQAGLNLLSNAIKDSPKGGEIHVSVKLSGEGEIDWSFKDSGIGLAPQERVSLFTKFFLADS